MNLPTFPLILIVSCRLVKKRIVIIILRKASELYTAQSPLGQPGSKRTRPGPVQSTTPRRPDLLNSRFCWILSILWVVSGILHRDPQELRGIKDEQDAQAL